MHEMKRWRWVLLVIPALIAGGFVVWAESTPQPMPEALQTLEKAWQADEVVVSPGPWIVFRRLDIEPSTGLVFYPGAYDRRSTRPLPTPLPMKDTSW